MKNQRTKEEMELINLGLSLSLSNEKLIESNRQLVEANGKAVRGFCDEYEQNKGLRVICFDAFRLLNEKAELNEEELELKDKMGFILSDFIV